MRIKDQLQMTSYDYHQHKQLEPNEVIIMGRQKRDKELPGFMHKVGHLTQQERDRINHEHEQQQDEYLKSKGI